MLDICVEQSTLRALLEVVAAAYVPPTVGVLILRLELCECDDGILEGGRTEWGTLQITILNVDVVVELRVTLTADH